MPKATQLFALVLLVFSAAVTAADDEAFEKKLLAEIQNLATTVNEQAALCDKHDPTCDLTALARLRFDLRDRLTRATKIDAELLDTLAKETDPSKAKKLTERHLAIVEALQPARDISFLVHDDRTPGDDLVELVKTINVRLSDAEARKDRTSVRQLRASLAELEFRLRSQGLEDRQTIKKIDETLKSGRLDLNYNKLVAERKATAARLAEIESLITLPAEGNPIYRVFSDDHENWWVHQFYAGAEFDSVGRIFNKGFPRIGYSNWLRIGGEQIPETHPRSGLGNYARFYEFHALLTSSAEQDVSTLTGAQDSPPNTDPCAAGSTSADPCVRKAFEVEEKLFWAVYRTRRHNRIQSYFGPVLTVGAKFVDRNDNDDALSDASAHADYRYYFGMHNGFARDAYGEILYGRTRSLHTPRLEVRGEVPVAAWGSDSRLLLGWVANFRAGRAKKRPTDDPPERDVFRVYLQYELDFLKLTGLKAPK